MTKADIISEIIDKTGIEKNDVSSTVEAFFSVVKESMSNGESIYVRGFGSFVNKKRARKVARDIAAKKPMVIEPHFVPSFKPAKTFVEAVKTNTEVTV